MSDVTYAPVDETQVEQRTLDWYRSRLGFWTGSAMGKLMGKSRDGGFNATAMSHIYQVAAERSLNPKIVEDDELFGEYLDQSNTETKAMRLGTEKEEDARDLFQLKHKVSVREVGSVKSADIPNLSASPDGIFTKDDELTVLEIKSPTLAVYQKYLMTVKDADTLKAVIPDYYWQVQTEMMCVGAGMAAIIFYQPFHKNPLLEVTVDADLGAFETIKNRIKYAEKIINEK